MAKKHKHYSIIINDLTYEEAYAVRNQLYILGYSEDDYEYKEW